MFDFNSENNLSVEDFENLIKDKKVFVLDVREKHEFEKGHIKNAKLTPSTNFDEEFGKLKIKKTDKIALYCRSGSRSGFILNKLLEKGYKKVYHLELGILDWEKQGRKLVQKIKQNA